MTWGTGSAERPRTTRPRRAFTLLEMLLVVGLLAFLGGLGISAVAPLVGDRLKGADEAFWAAVNQGRSDAIAGQQIVELDVAEGGRKLLLRRSLGEVTFELPSGTKLELTSIGAPWGPPNMSEANPHPISERIVRFYRDGTCDGARARISSEDGRHIDLSVDPWTAAKVLTGTGGSA